MRRKEQLDHGEWLPWLKKNFGSTNKTAENYMNAARFAAKFEIVSNLKLRPTALYRLGRELDDPTGLYNRQAIEAILKAAETRWINADEARAIAKALQPPKPDRAIEEIVAGPASEAIKAERAAAEQAARAEIDDIIDGSPPELSPASEPAVRDVILPPFDQAVATLAQLQTKPLGSFVATTHKPDKIRAISIFLQEVADAIERRRTPAVSDQSSNNHVEANHDLV